MLKNTLRKIIDYIVESDWIIPTICGIVCSITIYYFLTYDYTKEVEIRDFKKDSIRTEIRYNYLLVDSCNLELQKQEQKTDSLLNYLPNQEIMIYDIKRWLL